MHRYSTARGRAHPISFRGWSSRPRGSGMQQVRSAPPVLGPEIIVREIERVDRHTGTKNTKISNVEVVASYNLLQGLEKTILVPGEPPQWTPLPDTTTLLSDNGEYYRDENAARFSEHPMEPAVQSIFTMNPSFNPSDIDVFGCGSTFGNILRFAMGNPHPFSFTVHVVGKTAFLLRREHSPTELIEGVYGYGHAFAEANTTWPRDVKGSASHQRVINYSLGALQCLVRFEAGGSIVDLANDRDDDNNPAALPGETKADNDSNEATIDDLAENFAKAVSQTGITSSERSAESLVVRSQGKPTSQSSLFDIKTRSFWKDREDVMAGELPRLWVRQIHKFVLAFHEYGRFDPVEVADITSEMNEWEQKWQTAISRMAAILRDIRQTAMNTKSGKLEVRSSEASTLKFHELSATQVRSWDALPEGLQKRWAQEDLKSAD